MYEDLLLDVGGTDLKLGLCTGQGLEVLERVSILELLTWDGDFAYYPAMELRGQILTLIERQSKRKSGRLFISAQMSSGYIRGVHGREVFSWQSVGGKKLFTQSQNNLSKPEKLDLRAGSPVFTLPAAFPALFNGSFPGSAAVDTLGGFVADAVLGYRSDVRHYSDGYALGGYHVDGTPAVFEPGLGMEFPTLTRRVEVLGESLLFPGLKVYTPVGDQQASLLGVDLQENEIGINIGTGGQVAMRSNVVARDLDLQARPYWNNEYLLTLTHLPAGRLVNLYFRAWSQQYGGRIEEFLSLANEPAKEVDLEGEFPLNYSASRENFFLSNMKGLIESPEIIPTRLAYELSIVYSSRIDQLRGADMTKNSLVVAGGLATRFTSLSSHISKTTGMPLRAVNSPETTLDGLCRLTSIVDPAT